MASASPLTPTYQGHIASTQDALILFELCLSGGMNHVARRPHDRERVNLIRSGNVFIYEEHSSGIKRWTDGVPWSPSRILGNFLVYRELERPFPPGEKKRAMKRARRSPGIDKPNAYSSGANLSNGYNAGATASTFDGPNGTAISKETERSLIGSLVDSYGFKEGGLVKKTVSVTINGVSHHLVSYYTVADVTNGKLNSPTKDPRFEHITPRPELTQKQNFRSPVDEMDSLDRLDDRPNAYGTTYSQYPRSGYEMTNQSIAAHRPLPLPTPQHASHIGYSGHASSVYNNYAMPPTPTPYQTMNAGHSHTNFTSPFASSHGMFPPAKTEGYDLSGYRPQQRFSSVGGLNTDISRSAIPTPGQQFARRASNYEQHVPADAGLANMTPNSTEPKSINDPGYAGSQNYFNSRDGDSSPHGHNNQRFLPAPAQQPSYEQAQLPSYAIASNTDSKDAMWPPGNPGSGHGHYLNSQPWSNPSSS